MSNTIKNCVSHEYDFQPIVADPLAEDFLFFSSKAELPSSNGSVAPSTPKVPFLSDVPTKHIVTERSKELSEMSPNERSQALEHFRCISARKTIRAISGNKSAAGNREPVYAWTKRMGLSLPPTAREITARSEHPDLSPLTDLDRPPTAFEVAKAFGHDSDPFLHRRTEHDDLVRYQSRLSYRDADILDMSWPEQRVFRWNHPDEYAQWVEDLMEEMGPHFDESLVLPEYKFGERPQKPREVVEPDDIIETSEDAFISVNAHLTDDNQG